VVVGTENDAVREKDTSRTMRCEEGKMTEVRGDEEIELEKL
jgi:hypothetical protein